MRILKGGIQVKKKLLALLMTIVVTFGLQPISVSAATCMHEQGLVHAVSIVGHYTTQHRVSTGYYVGDTPIYVDCTVTHEVHRHNYYCTNCYAVVYYVDHDEEVLHSESHNR